MQMYVFLNVRIFFLRISIFFQAAFFTTLIGTQHIRLKTDMYYRYIDYVCDLM